MVLFRIATEPNSRDLSGRGAQLFGGRWNPKGMAALYVAESAAQALLEYLPHLPPGCVPPDLVLAKLEAPDALSIAELSERDLPPDWNALPWPSSTAEIGRRWLTAKATAALRVPSVMFPLSVAWNVVLNPAHPQSAAISIVETIPLPLDPRLAGKSR